MSNKKLKNIKKEEVKKPFFNRNKKVLALVLVLVVFLTTSLFIVDSFAPANPRVYHKFILSAFSGSFDGEDTPNTYYEVKSASDETTGEALYSCVNLKLTTVNSVKFKEIWVNISDIKANEITIFTSKGYAGNTKFLSERTFKRSDIKANKDGWFRVYNTPEGTEYNVPSFYGELKIGFSTNVRVREVVVVDVDNKLGSLTFKSCSVGKKPEKGDETGVSHTVFEDPTAKNVCDEKSKYIIK